MSTHQINLVLASGANLTLLHFPEEQASRWIFDYHYVGQKATGASPDIVNKVKLVADYADGILASQFVLSMHVVIPSRLGQQFFVGMDISPGAKTYLEFSYTAEPAAEEYRLVEISKGARERVRLDTVDPALVRPIEFPFPIYDRLPVVDGGIKAPFLLNNGILSYFELPTRTLR